LFDTTGERLYPIVDADTCRARGLAPPQVALACFRGGARVVQLRVKSGSAACFLDLTMEVVAAAAAFGAAVIVNDRPDIARMARAAGVHVGQDDLTPENARCVLGEGIIGLSTHDLSQVDEALGSAADYIAVGPVFGTATKDTGYSARGLELVRSAAGRGKPVVGIGGITLDRAPEVIGAGASSVAVITDLVNGGEPESRVREYLRALQ
jgi:thiamine-phosphate pyrophosphorylase